MPVATIELHGTPYEMGRQFGEELREPAQMMVNTRLELAAAAAAALAPPRKPDWCLDLAAEALPHVEQYSPEVYQELSGIAEGAGMTLPELVIGNGWTDFKDLMETRAASNNCTSSVVEGTHTADGHTYLAQTWDMNVSAGPYVLVVRRKPADGPETISLTTAGCLSLIGLNEHGIAIGNTNLTPTDARPGVFYLAVIHEALRQPSLDRAVEAVTSAHRMSGHYYYLGDAHERFVGVETTAARHATVAAANGRYAHTNHYLTDELLATGLAVPSGANSEGRLSRCLAMLEGLAEGVTVTELSQILGDHAGEHPLCRHAEPGGLHATLAGSVICPARREMWVWQGNPCLSEPISFCL